MVSFETTPTYLPIVDVAGTHMVQYRVRAFPAGDGFTLEEAFQLDGYMWHTLSMRTRSRQDVADAFEVAHHVLHGMPPQGLDPRQGPTRLHPGPGR